MNEYIWHPVHSDTYLVSGTRRQLGAIGIHDNFQIELTASSSREAYLTVVNDNVQWEHIHVIAIKMKCTQCGECHMTVPPELYL